MPQGGIPKNKAKAVKKATIHSKKKRTLAAKRPKPKRVDRDAATRTINDNIERIAAGRAAQAGTRLEISTLDTIASDSCRELRDKAKKSKKRPTPPAADK